MNPDTTTKQIRFDDGVAYERYMGKWSELAGDAFLDWLAPATGMQWLDVGCGSGAFTELFVARCQPASVAGIDPSDAQLAYARARKALQGVDFRRGDAMALPFGPDTFDVAVMPLVIFFVPEPAKGVAEMARVVRPGGFVAAYAWDMAGGGFPYQALMDEMRGMGLGVPQPPSPEASHLDTMLGLWTGAGLVDVDTRPITVRRTYADFDDYWETLLGAPSAGSTLTAMAPDDRAALMSRLHGRLSSDAAGRITLGARAHAVKGRVRRPGGAVP